MKDSEYTVYMICWMMRFGLFAASVPSLCLCSRVVLRCYIQFWTKWLQTVSAFVTKRGTVGFRDNQITLSVTVSSQCVWHCVFKPPFSEKWIASSAGELSGSSVAGSEDEDVDKVYRPRVTVEGSVSETIKTKRRISWCFENEALESTGTTPTFQDLLVLSSILWNGHGEQTFCRHFNYLNLNGSK